MCQTSLNRQKLFSYEMQGGFEATKRTAVHSNGPHFIQDIWHDNLSPEHLQNVMAWLWKCRPEGKLGAPTLLFDSMKGLKGFSDDLQLKFETKKCLELNLFNNYLRRTKRVVESILVSLVDSVQWRVENRGWTRWDDWMGGEEEEALGSSLQQ